MRAETLKQLLKPHKNSESVNTLERTISSDGDEKLGQKLCEREVVCVCACMLVMHSCYFLIFRAFLNAPNLASVSVTFGLVKISWYPQNQHCVTVPYVPQICINVTETLQLTYQAILDTAYMAASIVCILVMMMPIISSHY